MVYGAKLGCHQIPERSFFVRGYQFPVCARCTGLLTGYLIALITWKMIAISTIGEVIICIPLVIDGITQYIGWRMSNQILRIATGFICGVGVTRLQISLIVTLLNYIGGKLL